MNGYRILAVTFLGKLPLGRRRKWEDNDWMDLVWSVQCAEEDFTNSIALLNHRVLLSEISVLKLN
jgi:hypothetical protein